MINLPITDPLQMSDAQLALQLSSIVSEQMQKNNVPLQAPDYSKEFGEAMQEKNEIIHESILTPPYPSGLDKYFFKVLSNLSKVESTADLTQIQSLIKSVEKTLATMSLSNENRVVTVVLDPNLFPDTKVQLTVTQEGAQAQLITKSPDVQAFCQNNLSALKGLFLANRIDFKMEPVEKTYLIKAVEKRSQDEKN